MSREGKPLYEEMVFDNYESAKEIALEYKPLLEKIDLDRKYSLVAIVTIFGGLLLIAASEILGEMIMLMGLGLGIYSMVHGRGIKHVFSILGRIASIGWSTIPIFPLNLLLAIAVLWCGFWFMLFFPIVLININYKQVQLNYNRALHYLKSNKPVKRKTIPFVLPQKEPAPTNSVKYTYAQKRSNSLASGGTFPSGKVRVRINSDGSRSY